MASKETHSATVTQPSKTAEVVAAVRADHYKYYREPLFKDDLAVHFTGPMWGTVLAIPPLRWLVIYQILAKASQTGPVVVLRCLFGENQIPQAIASGVRQYVILGAGYDTFAMRRNDLMEQLTVFEIDQQATQAEKLRRMEKAKIPRPPNTHYITADFEREHLYDVLANSEFDVTQPAVFSWFGVTYYLTQDAIKETLQTISARMAPGSYVMFDYLADFAATPDDYKAVWEKTAAFVAKRGEPWMSSFDPAKLATYLQELGFGDIEHLAPQEVGGHYLEGRTDIVYPEFMGMLRAITRGQESS